MDKNKQLELKSRFNALIVGAQASLQEAMELRKALADGTGKGWHVEGPAYETLEDIIDLLDELPSYGKGAAFEKRPENTPVVEQKAPAQPQRYSERNY